MAQRIRRAERLRRQLWGDRGFVFLCGAARVPRAGEVAISEAPGPPPSYTFGRDVRLYGLGPPPARSRRPSAQWVGGRLASLLPDDLEVGAADEWGPEGLRFRVAHPPTRLHVYGSVRRIANSAEAFDAITAALGDALWRLRSAVKEATPPA